MVDIENRTKGRPTLLTPEMQEAICEGIRKGNYISTVMRGLGIDVGNHWNWYRKGKNGQLDSYGRPIYINYFKAINKAEAEAEERMVSQWQEFFPEDWRSIQTFMERRWGKRWGRNDKVTQEIHGKDGGPIEMKQDMDLSKLSQEELTQLETILTKTSVDGGTTEGESKT